MRKRSRQSSPTVAHGPALGRSLRTADVALFASANGASHTSPGQRPGSRPVHTSEPCKGETRRPWPCRCVETPHPRPRRGICLALTGLLSVARDNPGLRPGLVCVAPLALHRRGVLPVSETATAPFPPCLVVPVCEAQATWRVPIPRIHPSACPQNHAMFADCSPLASSP
jgi:hypothetical protein